MSAFAIVQSPDHLIRLCRDLTAFNEFHGGITGRSRPDALLGIWIEHDGSRPATRLVTTDWLSDEGSLPVAVSAELSGLWALCWTASPVVSREVLLEALVAAAGCVPGLEVSRFVPVFAEGASPVTSDLAWRRLARRHPGRVLPPIYQRADGALPLDDLGWAEREMAGDPLAVTTPAISRCGPR